MPHHFSSMKSFLFAVALIIPILTLSVPAAALMQLGDPAPPLDVVSWIQGPPLAATNPWAEAVHVVEFWSPDCPHCRDSIPMLNAIQEVHGSKVVVVGITEAAQEEIQEFRAKSESPVRYRIAIDAEGRTNEAYMDGFGINGVPHAFVVDRSGSIVWEGHPMHGLDHALEQIIAGTYDMAAQVRRNTAKTLIPVYLYLAERTAETDLLRQIAGRILDCAQDDADLLHRLASQIVLNNDIRHPDLATALRAVDTARRIRATADPELDQTREAILQRLGHQSGSRTKPSKQTETK